MGVYGLMYIILECLRDVYYDLLLFPNQVYLGKAGCMNIGREHYHAH